MPASDPDARERHDVPFVERALWSSYSRVYDGLLGFQPYRQLLRLVEEHARLTDATTLLDLGCGTGNLLARAVAANPGLRAVGVDSSEAMLRQAARKPALRDVSLVHADLRSHLLQTKPGSIDRVIATNVVYTLPERDAFWRHIIEVLSPDGIAVVTNPTEPGRLSLIREHCANDRFSTLLRPRLAAVFVADAAIGVLARRERFEFTPEEKLASEVVAAGGVITDRVRCYGGVDVLFAVRRAL